MTKIVLEKNEGALKEAIGRILQEHGYIVSDQGSALEITQSTQASPNPDIKEIVMRLEKSLYNEKKGVLYKSILEILEKPIIESVLERTEGNQFKAARILGLNRNTIRTKIKRLGIDPDAYKQ